MRINKFFSNLKTTNGLWKVNEISSLLRNNEKILDYGCGDLIFASMLYAKNKSLKITGVDVVESRKLKNINFVKYDGGKIPFRDNSFDTVVSVYVFHHTKSAEDAFADCVRVAKRRVIFIEAIAKSDFEILPMKFMDWLFNVWKPEPIPLTFQFRTHSAWLKIFRKNNVKLKKEKEIKNYLSSLPIGKAYLFEVEKKIKQ